MTLTGPHAYLAVTPRRHTGHARRQPFWQREPVELAAVERLEVDHAFGGRHVLGDHQAATGGSR
jgi:hypothetical protein